MKANLLSSNDEQRQAARHLRRFVLPPSVGAVILALSLCTPAAAMVVAPRDFADLVARAEQIVVGTVTDVSAQPDASGAPFTFVTLSDLTVLKGDVGATLTLRFYGGTANGVMTWISDMPKFTAGERVVLFVAGNGRDVCPLVGVWQGRFAVRFDSTRNTEVVESHDGRPVIGLAGRELRFAPAHATATSAAITLDEFRQVVSDELAHPQAGSGTPAAP